MQSKNAGGHPSKTFLETIFERGEGAIGQVLGEVLGRKGVAEQLGKSVGRAADAKRRLDHNMQFLLSLLNLPSRADYNKLLAKIEALQGSLVNLNMKLDRLLAAQQGQAHAAGRAAKPGPAATARSGRPSREA